METGEELGYRWRLRGGHPAPGVYEEQLWSGALTLFMVESAGSGEPVGILSAYQTDAVNGHCRFAAASFRSHGMGSRAMISASFLAFDYLFRGFPFRQVYLEVPEFNLVQFESSLSRGLFEREGCLRDYTYLNARYWDLHLLTLKREMWETFRISEFAWRLMENS